ncbi:MAG: hypothetical protein KJO76_11350, partial [Gammaproteobacteria bacterium]|nr:hypothetical protein [Gammaproteobacteria bacterium]
MRRFNDKASSWRMLLMIPVAVMAVLSIVATGGSSGDGGDIPDPPDIPPVIQPSYNFELGSLQGPTIPLTATVGSIGTVTVDLGNTLLGTINLNVSATNEVTLVSYTTDVGSTMNITAVSEIDPALSGSVTLNVTKAINANVFDPPNSGAFEIELPDALGTITVSITSTGVELSLNGGPIIPYTWDEFTDLLESESAQEWERVASLVGGTLEFVYEFFIQAADVLDDLEFIAETGSAEAACDMFTLPGPEGVLPEGMESITWLGAGGDIDGSIFDWQFTDCWFEEGEELYRGLIQLVNY